MNHQPDLTFTSNWIELVNNNSMGDDLSRKTRNIREYINYLENCIFWKNFDVLNEFHEDGNITSRGLCAKTFQKGEIGFTCGECTNLKPNSILCSECFQNSEHKNHEFRTDVCLVPWFCMCGHKEAWKNFSCCKLHNSKDVHDYSISPELLNRSHLLFEEVIQKAMFALTNGFGFENLGSGPAVVVSLSTSSVATRVSMIEAFQRFLSNCNLLKATMLVNSFSEYGRVLIKFTSLSDSRTFKSNIEEFFADKPMSFFQISLISVNTVLEQWFYLSLLSKLEVLLLSHEDFRVIFSKVMLAPRESNKTYLEIFLKFESRLCSHSNKKFQKLILIGMLRDLQGKIDVAKAIIRNIGEIAEDFQNYVFFDSSYFSFGLFNFPAVAQFLIANEDALFVVANRLLAATLIQMDRFGGFYFSSFSQRILFSSFCILLTAKPTVWTNELREGFVKGLMVFFKVLGVIQGAEPVTKRIGDHVEFDSNNTEGISVNLSVIHSTLRILNWCRSDREVLIKAYKLALETLESCRFNVPPYVSIHTPLNRLIAGLHLSLEKFGLNINGPEFQGSKPTIEELIEPALQIQVMIIQAEAGMWVRNGAEIQRLVAFYRNGNVMMDLDMRLIQIGASMTDSEKFIGDLLGRFWSPDIITNPPRVYESFLKLLINIIGERHFPEMSTNVEPNDDVRREIIHLLCLKPREHSILTDDVLSHHPEIDAIELDKIIDEMATFKVLGDGPGVHELKDEFFDQYDPFFVHYTIDEMFSSYEAQCKNRKVKFCPPPNLPRLKESFHGMVALLVTPTIHKFLEILFRRFLYWQEDTMTALILQGTLHLIGYALQEEQSGYYPFLTFSKMAKNWKLVANLEYLLKSSHAESHRDLIRWTLTKYKEVAKEELPKELQIDAAASEEQKRIKMIAERRAKIMNQMKMAQHKFLEENNTDNLEEDFSGLSLEETHTCIICQESERPDGSSNFILPAFVQKSAVFCPKTPEDRDRNSYPIFNTNCGCIAHTKTCSHVIHTTCWEEYIATQIGGRPNLPRYFEFQCPLCQCLRNTLLPVFPKLNQREDCETDFSAWLLTLPVFNPNMFSRNQKIIKAESISNEELVLLYTNFSDPDIPDEFAIRQSLAYTLHSLEVSLRDSNKPLLGHLSTSDETCLKVLIQIFLQSNTFNYLSVETVHFVPSEPLDILFHLMLLAPSASRTSPHFIRLCLIAHIGQILMASNFPEDENVVSNSESPVIRILHLLSRRTSNLDESKIWRYVQEASLPFLRCSVLLYRYMTEKLPPSSLTEPGGDTFSNMCLYMGIPQTQQEMFSFNGMLSIIVKWCSSNFRNTKMIQPSSMSTNQLIALPEDYTDLIEQASVFRCSSSHQQQISKQATLCLLCGKMVCSGGFCCKKMLNGVVVGGCYYHTSECGKNVGMFLSISTFKVLLLSMNGGGHTWIPFPYINRYGELFYNYPIRLCPKKYKALNSLWINHGVLELIAQSNPIKYSFNI